MWCYISSSFPRKAWKYVYVVPHFFSLSASRTSAAPSQCRCSSEGQAFTCRLSLSVATCQHADIMQVPACNFRSLTSQLNSRGLYIPMCVTPPCVDFTRVCTLLKDVDWSLFFLRPQRDKCPKILISNVLTCMNHIQNHSQSSVLDFW